MQGYTARHIPLRLLEGRCMQSSQGSGNAVIVAYVLRKTSGDVLLDLSISGRKLVAVENLSLEAI